MRKLRFIPFISLLFVLGLFVVQANDITQPGNLIDAALTGSWDVQTGDINGDGLIDVAAAGHYDDAVVWYANNGDSTYTKGIVDSNFDGVTAVDIADIDMDGDNDVISVAENTGEVAWFTNDNGDGTAWTKVTIGTIDNPASIDVGDIDSDGDLDVAVAGSDVFAAQDDITNLNGEVAWFANTDGMGGTWSAKQTIDADFPGTTSVVLGDLDGDGSLDVVANAAGESTIAYYSNDNGDGTAWTQNNVVAATLVLGVPIPTTGFDGVNSVEVADINGDGALDVIGASVVAEFGGFSITSAGVKWFQNDGGGGTWTETAVALDATGRVGLSVVDVDGDGHTDIVATDPVGQELTWYENLTGDGSTWAEDITPGTDAVSLVGAVSNAYGDADNDGDFDLFVAASDLPPAFGGAEDATGRVILFENNMGGQRNTVLTGLQSIDEGFGAETAITADVTGNGGLEVIATSPDTNTLAYWQLVGENWNRATISTTTTGANIPVAADMDGDGDTDLVIGATNGNTVTVFLNSNNGLTWTPTINALTAPISLDAGDIDKDGDLDILYAAGGELGWLENGGIGDLDFTNVIDDTIGATPFASLADIDGDGTLDALLNDPGDNTLKLYANDGTGTFGTPQPITTITAPQAFLSNLAEDLDNDGDLDILMATTGDLYSLENNGDGTFGTPQPITTGLAIRIPTTGDWNADGLPDLVVADLVNGGINRLANTGIGFGDATVIDETLTASFVDIVDLDGDGDNDFVSAVGENGDVIWWENQFGPRLVTNNILTIMQGGDAQPINTDLLQTRDNDTPTNELIYTLTSIPAQGTLTINELGTLVVNDTVTQAQLDAGIIAYAPPALATSQTFTFDFDLSDGVTTINGAGTFVIEVTADNTAPVANDDEATTDEETAITVDVLANDEDPDEGDTLTIVAVETTGTQGTVNNNGTNVIYDPNGAFDGLGAGESDTDTFAYTIEDELGEQSTATVTVTINGLDEEPADIAVTELLLIDATNDVVITPLTDGATIGLNTLPVSEDELNILAVTDPLTVGSVLFNLNGDIATENIAPYAYFGDESGDFNAGSLPAGTYDLTVIPYTESGAGGDAGTPISLSFTLVETGPTPEPTPEPTADPEPTAEPTPPGGEVCLAPDPNDAAVRPAFNWTLTETAARYQLVLWNADESLVMFNEEFDAGEICDGTNCTLQTDMSLLPYGLINGNNQLWSRPAGSTPQDWAVVTELMVDRPAAPVPGEFSVSIENGYPVITIPNDLNTNWYWIYMSTPDFSEVVYFRWFQKTTDLCCGATCTLVPNANPMNGDYVVYLRGWGPGGISEGGQVQGWSNPQSFSLNRPAAGEIQPLTTTFNNGEVTFNWQAAPDATWYRLWVGTDAPDFETQHNTWYRSNVIGCFDDGICTVTPDDLTLTPGETYVWYMQTWGPGGIDSSLGTNGWQLGSEFTP